MTSNKHFAINAHNINTENIEIFENFNTTIKQRIFSNGKQVIRIDTEDYFKKTCHFMNEKFDFYDLIILSDHLNQKDSLLI